jgi:hypothetical protein
MRLIGIICILLISFSLQANRDITQLRNFLEGFLSTIKGDRRKIQLPENCLGKNQEEEFNRFLESILTEHPLKAFMMASKFFTELEINCPINEIKEIKNDLKNLLLKDRQSIFEIIASQSHNLLNIFQEFETDIKKKSTLDEKAETVGKYLGKAFNKILYSNTNDSKFIKFLGLEDLFEKQTPDQQNESQFQIPPMKPMAFFVDGFFEGVSSVPYEHNKCHTDITQVRLEIVETFENFIHAIKSETGVIEAFMKIYALVTELKGLDANCHFQALSIDLMALTTKIGIAKMFYRLSTHMVSTMSDITTFFANYKVKEYRACGVSFGMLIKTALNYSTI